jgi:hypothetical protein
MAVETDLRCNSQCSGEQLLAEERKEREERRERVVGDAFNGRERSVEWGKFLKGTLIPSLWKRF